MKEVKISIICGDVLNNGLDVDGKLINIEGDDSLLHVFYLIDFLENNYNDIEIFKKLNYKVLRNTIGYFISEFTNSIIFFNTTVDAETYGKTGTFIIPANISEKQIDKLREVSLSLDDFRSVSISYDMTYIDGIIYDSSLRNSEGVKTSELIEQYLDIYTTKKAK